MAAPLRVMMSCGEASGDVYAAALSAALGERSPGVEVFGFGGPRLEAAGASLIGNYRRFTVTGLVEALSVIPRSYGMLRQLVAAARAHRPDVFVAIDFPDFNFRLLPAITRLGIPIVYYVSPQLWAWRPGRLATIRKYVDRMLVIFPFEAPIYEHAGVPVEFVGHPLIDLIPPAGPRDVFLRSIGLDPADPVVALLPGSRPSEVNHILPTLVDAASTIAERVPRAQFVLARAPGLSLRDMAPFASLASRQVRAAMVEDATDDVLSAADVVVTASGTATVQTALHDRPMVIVYRLSRVSYLIFKRLVRLSTYGMVNLVAGRRIVTELIQDDFTPERVVAETVMLLTDHVRADAMRADLREVRTRLGGPGATARAADAILKIVNREDVKP